MALGIEGGFYLILGGIVLIFGVVIISGEEALKTYNLPNKEEQKEAQTVVKETNTVQTPETHQSQKKEHNEDPPIFHIEEIYTAYQKRKESRIQCMCIVFFFSLCIPVFHFSIHKLSVYTWAILLFLFACCMSYLSEKEKRDQVKTFDDIAKDYKTVLNWEKETYLSLELDEEERHDCLDRFVKQQKKFNEFIYIAFPDLLKEEPQEEETYESYPVQTNEKADAEEIREPGWVDSWIDRKKDKEHAKDLSWYIFFSTNHHVPADLLYEREFDELRYKYRDKDEYNRQLNKLAEKKAKEFQRRTGYKISKDFFMDVKPEESTRGFFAHSDYKEEMKKREKRRKKALEKAIWYDDWDDYD